MKNIKKRILLISPYLDVLGGGEKHILSILSVFDKAGYFCDIQWHDSAIMKEFKNKFGIKFAHADIVPSPLPSAEYDHCLYVTDGSYFFSHAKHKYIFFMYPKKELLPLGTINRIKTRDWQLIANGDFTGQKISTLMKKPVAVIYPYVDDSFFLRKKTEKSNVILSVGRFFPHLHSKRQDILIEAFRMLQRTAPSFGKYTLILAGGLGNAAEDKMFFENLQKMAGHDASIKFMVNLSQTRLCELYAHAEIYWHAAGYGLDEDRDIEGVEHVGITPLEAMAAGCVVFCHASGGPKRYIQSGKNGYLYQTMQDLIEKTARLSQKEKIDSVAQGQKFVADNFSETVFENKVKEYFLL